MKLNWNFLRGGDGGGVQTKKTLCGGGYGYFLELHNMQYSVFNGGILTLHTLVGDKWLCQSPRTGSTKLPYI